MILIIVSDLNEVECLFSFYFCLIFYGIIKQGKTKKKIDIQDYYIVDYSFEN